MCPRALHLQRQVIRSDSHPDAAHGVGMPKTTQVGFPGTPKALLPPPPSGLSYLPRRAALVSAVGSQNVTFPVDFSFLAAGKAGAFGAAKPL